MMGSNQKKKAGPIQGCLVPLLAVVGLLALCYVVCFVIYLINLPFISGGGNTGGLILPFFH